jgi:hypothetical protein
MIETLIKPQSLDNDIAVMKILQLLGQLSLNDIDYICNIVNQVHNLISEKSE